VLANLNIQSMRLLTEGSTPRERDLNQLLPAGKSLPATVTSVTQHPTQISSYRIQAELAGRLIELITSRPLPQGSQVTLSRDAQGNLQLQLANSSATARPMPEAAAQASGREAAAQAKTNLPTFILNISTSSLPKVATLPLNTPLPGVILSSPQDTAIRPNAPQLPTSANTTPTNTAPAPSTTSAPANPAPANPVNTAPANSAPASPAPPSAASNNPVPVITEASNRQPATAPSASSTTEATNNRPLPAALQPSTSLPRPQGFAVRVAIAGITLDLIAPRPLQSGQQITASVTENGRIMIQLPQPALPIAQQAQTQAIMNQALREVLPTQLPLADGLNQLMQLTDRTSVKQNSALNQLIQSMLNLFSVKPGSPEAGETIARNLQQGGLLTEGRLSQTSGQNQPVDLKQQLGQLLKLSEQLPTQVREQLSQLVNALLSRSTSQQISSLQQWRELPDGGQERHYRLDLPIQQQDKLDNAELRITEHRRRDEQGEFVTLWSVHLHFNLEEAGAVDADLMLREDLSLSARFWAEQKDTLQLIQNRLIGFEADLRSQGFNVEPIHVRLGKAHNPVAPLLQKRLVDLHT